MNHISHAQARFLIRLGMDAPLPEEQWAVLQGHLEECADCRTYQQRLTWLEHHLQHVLAGRWAAVFAPLQLAERVTGARAARKVHWRRLRYGLLSLFALVTLSFLGWTSHLLNQPPAPSPSPPLPTPTPAERFQDITAFSAGPPGKQDIYIFNPGGPGAAAQFTNLTDAPADYSAPAWSPDGAWLAFLSNRAGKAEVYVETVAGTRLTQLSAVDQVDWQGPLSWSPDGKWLALIGRRRLLANEPWLYLVGTDGSGARVLPGTAGVIAPVRFSQTGPYLIYPSPQPDSLFIRYAIQTGEKQPLAVEDAQELRLSTQVTGFFQYHRTESLEQLVYLAQGSLSPAKPLETPAPVGYPPPAATLPAATPQATLTGSPPQEYLRWALHSLDTDRTAYYTLVSGPPGAFRGVTYNPLAARIAFLENDQGCWTVHLLVDNPEDTRPLALTGMCVRGALLPEQWSQDGHWLVVWGRQAGTASPALYALHIPQLTLPAQDLLQTTPETEPPSFALLAHFPGTVTGLSVRPAGLPLEINPNPAHPQPAAPPEALPPMVLPGPLLLTEPVQRSDLSLLFQTVRSVIGQPNPAPALPDTAIVLQNPGGGRQVLVPADARNTCPARQPGGDAIIFTSNRSGAASGNEIYRVDPSGGAPLLLTQPFPGYTQGSTRAPSYACPVWAPDGRFFAVLIQTARSSGLQVITPTGQVLRYLPVDAVSNTVAPLWTPDENQILLVEPAQHGGPARIVEVPLLWPTSSHGLLPLVGWDDIQALSLSADGGQLALLAVRQANASSPARAELMVFSYPELAVLYQKELPAYNPAALQNQGRLFWLQEHQLVFAIPMRPTDLHKAAFVRYTPAEDAFQYLAYSDDALLDWTIKDGWLVYSSESGLWKVPINDPLDRPAAPVWLAGVPPITLNLP